MMPNSLVTQSVLAVSWSREEVDPITSQVVMMRRRRRRRMIMMMLRHVRRKRRRGKGSIKIMRRRRRRRRTYPHRSNRGPSTPSSTASPTMVGDNTASNVFISTLILLHHHLFF